MSEQENKPQQVNQDAQKRQLGDIEAVRDLFARAHDYIAQASHPGHMGAKVGEVLNFLAFQYNDFKVRAENLKKQIESTVNVETAKAATAETLKAEAPVTAAPMEDPKA